MPDRAARLVVIGVGNEYRRCDGFGPCVVAELDRRATAADLLGGTFAPAGGPPPGVTLGSR